MEKVELLKEHEHAGQKQPAGTVLELDADTARWLVEQGVARAVVTESKRSRKQED